MRTLLQTVEKVLDHDVNLLLLGESGSGKDFFAEAIHACGNRRDKPLVKIDCAAFPPNCSSRSCSATRRAPSPTRSRASSANSRRRTAARSTSTTSPRFLRRCRRSCSARSRRSVSRASAAIRSIALDGRVISSSSMPAEELLSGLRRDLFYRINVVTLTIPPLRERREDIPRLAKTFLARRKRGIDAEAMRMLIDYDWPGNVRELRNVIERAALLEDERRDHAASLPPLSADIVETAVTPAVDARRARIALHPRNPAPDEIELQHAPRRSSASIARRCWRSGRSMGSSEEWGVGSRVCGERAAESRR